MPKILSDAERKAKEEKNNELITRAESVIAGAKAENRELTDDEKYEKTGFGPRLFYGGLHLVWAERGRVCGFKFQWCEGCR